MEGEMDLIELTNENYESTLNTCQAGMILFYAPWCGVCKAHELSFRSLAQKYGLAFMRMDAEAHDKANSFRMILGFPTLALVKEGNVVEWVNTTRETTLERLILKAGFVAS